MPETSSASRLESCYQRGLRLTNERDYDYAHEMFAQCVIHAPSNVVYAEAVGAHDLLL